MTRAATKKSVTATEKFRPRRQSVAMIRPSRQDCRGAVDLFGEHHPRQGVRPGLNAEGQPPTRDLQDAGRQTVGPADREGQLALTLIAQSLQQAGEVPGGQGRAVLVAGDQMGAVKTRQQGFGLGGLAGFAPFDLDKLHRTQAQSATGGGGAGGVVPGQGIFRRGAQSTDAEQSHAQATAIS